MAKSDAAVTPDDIAAVSLRCEQSYHAITALHDLCQEAMSGSGDQASANTFVLLREALRSLARDMENCAEILDNDRGGLGYFEAHYGSV
ncbi:hypothetical protein [Paraburkholderia sp. SIMBA_054]|uniref:hypothetical protein n=1 Tax=Paraburkholderia sp. SIMBA_054 TaxID=3085795 RepID=UPI003979B009